MSVCLVRETRLWGPKGNTMKALINQLKDFLGRKNVLTDPAELLAYSYDNSRRSLLPDAVVFATEHEHVVRVIQLCNEFKVPITPRGRGTGTPGGSIPAQGGLVLSLE